MDLVEEIENMSWRRFMILCNGLSGNSVYIAIMDARKNGRVPIDTTENPQQAERVAKNFFGV